MMTTKKNLSKILGPVLLLTASLSLPAVSTAAPSPDRDKGRKEQKVKQNQKHRQEQKRENAQHRAQQQRENAKHRAQQQRENAKHRAEQQRTAQRRVVQQQRVVQQRQPVYQQRVAQRQPAWRNRPWYGWERGRGSGAFVLDGTFVDMQYGCQLIREHSGRVIPIVGNGGGIRKGDHVRLTGRVDNSTVCGPAFRVSEVEAIWADGSHGRTIFDRRRDGDFDGSWLEDDEYRRQGRYPNEYRNGRRVPEGYRGDDRYYEDDYDDRYDGNGRLISVDGRLGGNNNCPSLRASNGDLFGLEGDLSDWRQGENVRVVGFLDNARSGCGFNRTISIHEINER